MRTSFGFLASQQLLLFYRIVLIQACEAKFLWFVLDVRLKCQQSDDAQRYISIQPTNSPFLCLTRSLVLHWNKFNHAIANIAQNETEAGYKYCFKWNDGFDNTSQ